MCNGMVLYYLIVGGFSLLILADLFQVWGMPSKAPRLLGYLGVGLSLFSLCLPVLGAGLGVSVTSNLAAGGAAGMETAADFLRRNPGLFGLLALLVLISSAFLIWTVFIELAFWKKRVGMDSQDTVRRGSYGLCRHPGFWWLGLLLLFLCLLGDFLSTVAPAALMVFSNLALIIVQDRFIFPRLFSGYTEYKKEVPFLIPRVRNRGFRQGR